MRWEFRGSWRVLDTRVLDLGACASYSPEQLRGKTSHTGLEALNAMYRLFYDSFNLVGDTLFAGVGFLRFSVVRGPAEPSE